MPPSPHPAGRGLPTPDQHRARATMNEEPPTRRWHRRPMLSLLASLALAACGAPAQRGTPPAPSPRPSSPGATPMLPASTPATPTPGTPATPAGPGAWQYAGSLRDARFGHTATLLRDRQVLVVGGRADMNQPLA